MLLTFGVAACVDATPIDLGVHAEVVAGDAPDVTDATDSADLGGDTSEAGPETVTAPCLTLRPSSLDFRGVGVGESATLSVDIVNCGSLPVAIATLAIDGADAARFHVAAPDGVPFAIAPQALATVTVSYTPTSPAPHDSEEHPIAETARLTLIADPIPNMPPAECPLSGWGVAGDVRPMAVIQVQEGATVPAATVLHLDGRASRSPAGQAIVGYHWSVVAPSGAVARFEPDAAAATPTYAANVVGEYAIGLVVRDALGHDSLASTYRVTVTPPSPAGIFVELVWHTPGDVNEADEGDGFGSDLDLHFLHPNANKAYFNFPFDVFFENKNPNWTTMGSEDDPVLSRDDNNGGGPEDVTLAVLQANMQYRVGANYWSDWGYGPTYATLRVYIAGVLAFHWDDVQLRETDMWDICTIDWPSGVVLPIQNADGGPLITPNFAGEDVLP